MILVSVRLRFCLFSDWKILNLLTATKHFAAKIRVEKFASRLQPITASTGDHRAVKMGEGFQDALIANFGGKCQDGMAYQLEFLASARQIHMMKVFRLRSDFLHAIYCGPRQSTAAC